jgi:uncharacterized protein with PQ loop repeat
MSSGDTAVQAPAQAAEPDIFETSPYAKAYKMYMLFFVAVFGYSFLFVQAATILAENSTRSFSLPSTLILVLVSSSWIVYAFLKKDKVLMVSSTISLIGSFFILLCCMYVDLLSPSGDFYEAGEA